MSAAAAPLRLESDTLTTILHPDEFFSTTQSPGLQAPKSHQPPLTALKLAIDREGPSSPITLDTVSTSSSEEWPPSTTTTTTTTSSAQRRAINRLSAKIDANVLQNIVDSCSPSIYIFIFVNPRSGDEKGRYLIDLPIQKFRLRKIPEVQVEIHNILEKEDRETGIANVALVASQIDELIPIGPGKVSPTVSQRHIQVWSAGGDGTVMSVVELLDEYDIDLDLVYFSCIPFGTGNDFSQVLGWGRTIPHKDVLGNGLHHLEELVCDRLTHSEAARLDIWGIEMTSHTSGYVRLAGPNRTDGHDVPEIRKCDDISQHSFARKMSNYMSIGVQGYVGSGFEKHRAGNRLANMMVYTIESAKWVFWRHFPPVTAFIDEIVMGNETVLKAPKPHEKNPADGSVPVMTKHPIDFVIQNIPHIWGREVDLWGEARSGLECVSHRAGPTDPNTWRPQLANDGRMEIMVINTMASYIKKLANLRKHVSRLGQFQDPFEIRFRDPKDRKSVPRWRLNRYERENIICLMCDGEFYVLKDPKAVTFKLHSTIWTLGRNDGHIQGRLVLDERRA